METSQGQLQDDQRAVEILRQIFNGVESSRGVPRSSVKVESEE